jgi:arylsulfatase A-like enzyme/Tfp pilus assembly protein PilF
MLRYRTLVLCALLVLVAACRREPGGEQAAREAGLNVLLITIDTLRADALGSYGNTRAATPILDRLAAGGVRFSHARAHTVVTLPSHANILSGRYPFRHGVRENAGFRFPASMETLATLLKARGYRTGAFVSAFPLDRRFGLDRGFDIYDDRYGKSGEHDAFRVPERSAVDTASAALAWIGAAPAPAASPYFAWVHVYEPHFPYAPPEPFASRFPQAPYSGEVATVDTALARLVEPILARGADDRTLVIVTSDHGESLGEHGEMTHGLFAYEGTLRVPLILFAPRLFKPRVVDEPVRHVDILPTVLDALAQSQPQELDGRSLVTIAAGRANGDTETNTPTYFESLSASLNRGWAPLYGIARGPMKYVDLPIPELYDLSTDPGEQHNLLASRPGEVRELQNLLGALRREDQGSSRAPESAETRERLRSLGYVSGTAPAKARYTEADDPKRLIHLDRAIEDVVSRYLRGDLRGAITLGRDLVRQRPNMPLTLVHLAFLYNEAGHHVDAIDAIRKALALNPEAKDVAALAGAYLTEGGRSQDAVTLLAPYAADAQADVDVLIAYGVALASVGKQAEALAAFDRAGREDPTNAMPLVNIGTVYLMAGDRHRAVRAFTQAVELDPRSARAHNGLGVVAAERQSWADAIASWERAVSADPHDYEALYNLGDVHARLGRTAEARSYWRRYLEVAPAHDSADATRVRQWLTRH